MSNNINEQQYPVVDKNNTLVTPPPPMGYPTKNAPQQKVPVVTTSKGKDEQRWTCSCRCCCCFLGCCD
ncbi:hypothetical protein QL285_081914 [Trifolium repens]|nr:hypothetical protein QL285_081914 [Trifolium repens]